jgi:adenylate cyclase
MEIERKYLVCNDKWRSLGVPVRYSQGYFIGDSEKTVRVRVAGENGFLTIKGISIGFSRKEFEYRIPLNDANELLLMCSIPLIGKYRTKILYEDKIWEVDEFEGDNKGLILAEIELKSEDETFSIPPWIGREVTGDIRYYNFHLATCPFKNWMTQELP